MRTRLLLLSLLLPSLAFAGPRKKAAKEEAVPAGKEEAVAAWREMVARSDAFDPSVFDLYTADATLLVTEADGPQVGETKTYPVGLLKQMAGRVMAVAKLVDDRGVYGELTVTPEGEGWRIAASREVLIRCATDDTYAAVMRSDGGVWKVAHEVQLHYGKNRCAPDPAVARGVLARNLELLQPLVPVEMDSETRLIGVEVADLQLVQRHTLLNIDRGTADWPELQGALRDAVVGQTCKQPNAK